MHKKLGIIVLITLILTLPSFSAQEDYYSCKVIEDLGEVCWPTDLLEEYGVQITPDGKWTDPELPGFIEEYCEQDTLGRTVCYMGAIITGLEVEMTAEIVCITNPCDHECKSKYERCKYLLLDEIAFEACANECISCADEVIQCATTAITTEEHKMIMDRLIIDASMDLQLEEYEKTFEKGTPVFLVMPPMVIPHYEPFNLEIDEDGNHYLVYDATGETMFVAGEISPEGLMIVSMIYAFPEPDLVRISLVAIVIILLIAGAVISIKKRRSKPRRKKRK